MKHNLEDTGYLFGISTISLPIIIIIFFPIIIKI